MFGTRNNCCYCEPFFQALSFHVETSPFGKAIKTCTRYDPQRSLVMELVYPTCQILLVSGSVLAILLYSAKCFIRNMKRLQTDMGNHIITHRYNEWNRSNYQGNVWLALLLVITAAEFDPSSRSYAIRWNRYTSIKLTLVIPVVYLLCWVPYHVCVLW